MCSVSSPTEINAYSDAVPQFASRDASIIFASVDSEYSLLSWANAARKDGGLGGVKFPLFSDKNHKLAIDYGVLIEERGIALRGLFVIDPTGTIRQVSGVIYGVGGMRKLLMYNSRSRSTTSQLEDQWMRP